MNRRVATFVARVGEWADAEPGVRAAVLIGSQARLEEPADEWSDVDVALLVDDPEAVARDVSWVERLGTPELTFVTRTPGGDPERRVLYADGLEVDFAVLPSGALEVVRREPAAQDLVRRGFRILYVEDGGGIALLPQPSVPPVDVEALANDLWYHALWTAKKLHRGETIVARDALERHLKTLLLRLAREHAARRGIDTWHADRFAERWADPRARAALWASAAAPRELRAAVWAVCDAFDALAAELDGLPAGAAAARARLEALLPARGARRRTRPVPAA
jgi:aminoglycoside 6-adenylyltransferase